MNKHFLKNIRDNMPETFKYMTYPLFRNKLIKNTEFRKFTELLTERESMSEESVKDYQFHELRTILNYAYIYVPYYTKLFDQIGFRPQQMTSFDEINAIPFLTKELIRENFESLISIKNVPDGHYVSTTGGTTGEPLKVLLDYNCVFKENAFVYHFRKKLDYHPEDRLVTFRGVEFGNKFWKYNPMYNELIFSPFKLSYNSLLRYVERINLFKPKYLNGYLSILNYFATLLYQNNLKLKYPLKGIFLISENIDIEKREFLEKFFQAPSSTFYGHSERCIIAQESQPNRYLFDPFYGYTELVPKQKDIFEIVGTGFLNNTMPLIRYKTNDICEKKENGSISIVGRWNVNDYLVGVNDERVFHSAFNFHSDVFKNVMNYQFIQTQRGKADLLLLVNQNFNSSEIDVIQKNIERKTKGVIEFNIIQTDHLHLTKNGKFQMFISELNKKY